MRLADDLRAGLPGALQRGPGVLDPQVHGADGGALLEQQPHPADDEEQQPGRLEAARRLAAEQTAVEGLGDVQVVGPESDLQQACDASGHAGWYPDWRGRGRVVYSDRKSTRLNSSHVKISY